MPPDSGVSTLRPVEVRCQPLFHDCSPMSNHNSVTYGHWVARTPAIRACAKSSACVVCGNRTNSRRQPQYDLPHQSYSPPVYVCSSLPARMVWHPLHSYAMDRQPVNQAHQSMAYSYAIGDEWHESGQYRVFNPYGIAPYGGCWTGCHLVCLAYHPPSCTTRMTGGISWAS